VVHYEQIATILTRELFDVSLRLLAAAALGEFEERLALPAGLVLAG
jgi:hypothetical protein